MALRNNPAIQKAGSPYEALPDWVKGQYPDGVPDAKLGEVSYRLHCLGWTNEDIGKALNRRGYTICKHRGKYESTITVDDEEYQQQARQWAVDWMQRLAQLAEETMRDLSPSARMQYLDKAAARADRLHGARAESTAPDVPEGYISPESAAYRDRYQQQQELYDEADADAAAIRDKRQQLGLPAGRSESGQ